VNLAHFDVQLGWVDVALLCVLGLSVLVGLWRGFVFEILSLLGWVVAFVLANSLGPLLADFMPLGDAGSPLRLWAAYILVFVLVLVTCTLLARLLRALVSATPLSFVDHLLGGVFGAARGALILVVVGVLVLVTCTLLARLLRALVSATPLSFVDHLLGGVFGAARGALILVVVGVLVSLSPYAAAPAWKSSHGALWLGMALEGLKPMLPQSLNVHIAT
jgi:membrane protein required for colicin V production